MTFLITCSVRKSLPFPAEHMQYKANVGNCPSQWVAQATAVTVAKE